jgi:hypothetical protein
MGKSGANKTKPKARRMKADSIRSQSHGEKQTLAGFLMNSPLRVSGIDLERVEASPREIDFGFDADENEPGKEL